MVNEHEDWAYLITITPFECCLYLVQMAILIDCVREEMRMENCQRISRGNQVIQAQKNSCHSTAFWNDGPLELVGLVLRPPKGGPPSLPEYGDAVILSL